MSIRPAPRAHADVFRGRAARVSPPPAQRSGAVGRGRGWGAFDALSGPPPRPPLAALARPTLPTARKCSQGEGNGGASPIFRSGSHDDGSSFARASFSEPPVEIQHRLQEHLRTPGALLLGGKLRLVVADAAAA